MGKTPGRLGVWLNAELTKRGYNLERGGQSKFAREADVHASMINRILSEDRGAEVDVLRRIGKALGYNLGEMLLHAGMAERDELPPRPPDELQATSDNPYTDPQERHIWAIPGMSDEDKRMFLRLLRTIRAEENAPEERPSAEVRQLRRPS
ncbi:helix-turn-helix domain-containing protein [Nonomuraea sp. SYSU D8015]|uniref:helix-turn-helix domain-containing protein n=1 Tax=Nonomuraea sp. SYSU D8015 TaxID=2593644 RepID=UPI00166103E2|nr:helix-turn-helix transcriptional regulator [Nonomuraea sp. SYSU D8015]